MRLFGAQREVDRYGGRMFRLGLLAWINRLAWYDERDRLVDELILVFIPGAVWREYHTNFDINCELCWCRRFVSFSTVTGEWRSEWVRLTDLP